MPKEAKASPSAPMIELQFKLNPVVLVASRFERRVKSDGSLKTFKTSGKTARDPDATELKSGGGQPKGLKALALAFVRARLCEEAGFSSANLWTLLKGQSGSPAFTLAGVLKDTNVDTRLVWVKEFCGCFEDMEKGDVSRCGLYDYFEVKHFPLGKSGLPVEIQFKPAEFRPSQINIQISGSRKPATVAQLRQIEQALLDESVWTAPEEFEIPAKRTDEPESKSGDNVSLIRSRLIQARTRRELQELLYQTEELPSNPESKLLIEDIKDALLRMKVPIPLTPFPASALEPYRRHLAGKFWETSVGGLGGAGVQSEAGGKVKLAKVFIDLDVKAETGAYDKLKPEAHGQHAPDKVPALEPLARHRRLVLVGLPGSGKSTLLKFFSLCLVQCGLKPDAEWLKHLKLWPKEETDLIPVFVELRQFSASLPAPLPAVDGAITSQNIFLSNSSLPRLRNVPARSNRRLPPGGPSFFSTVWMKCRTTTSCAALCSIRWRHSLARRRPSKPAGLSSPADPVLMTTPNGS